MKQIIAYFCKNTFIVNLLSAVILLAGVAAIYSVPRALMPPMKFNVIEVSATLPGASALEIEENVAIRIEESLQNITGLKSISTTSSKNTATLSLTFLSDYDLDEGLERVNALLQGMRSELPRDLRDLQAKIKSNDSEFLAHLTITGYDANNKKHQTWLREYMRKILLLPAVVKVTSSVAENYLSIKFKSNMLQKYGIDLVQVRNQIMQALEFYPVGLLSTSSETMRIKISEHQDQLLALKELPIKVTSDGLVLKLNQLADVDIAAFPQPAISFQNGSKTESILILKNLHSDSLEVVQTVKDFIAKHQTKVPSEIKVEIQGEGSIFIKRQLDILKDSALMGMALIVILLSLLVGFRVAIVAAMGLPVAFAIVMLVLWWLGMSINLVSVVAMLLVVGILVDDAIIVAEKFADLLQSGYSRYQAALEASQQMLVPVTGTVLTTIIVFVPILALPNEMSIVMAAIPIVVITALIASWFECFILLPNHLHHFVTKLPSRRTRIINRLAQKYANGLSLVLRWRYFVALLGAGMLFFAIIIASKLQFSGNLTVNDAAVRIGGQLAIKSEFEATRKKIEPLLQELQSSLPKKKIEHFSISIGQVNRWDTTYEPNKFYIHIELKQNLKHLESELELLEQLSETIIAKHINADFATLTVSKTNKQTGRSEETNLISVFVYGAARTPLSQIEKLLIQSLPSESGITLSETKADLLEKTWQFVPDTIALEKYHLSKAQISEQIRNLLSNSYLKDIYINEQRLEIYTSQDLISGDLDKIQLKDLQGLSILNAQFEQVPLTFLGQWQEHFDWRSIKRLNGVQSTELKVKFDPKIIDRAAATAKLESIFQSTSIDDRDLRFSLDAPDDNTEESKSWMITMGAIGVLAIFLILALVLGNLTQIFIVGAAIPFGALGALVALYMHGQPLGIMAAIGLLAVAGVAVNDSLILVDAVNKSGATLHDRIAYRNAIIEGARSRFRPIILTTLTTVLGVFPMAYGLIDESGFTQPIPFVLTWGLMSACVLTLIMIPVLIELRADFFHFGRWINRKTFKRKGPIEA